MVHHLSMVFRPCSPRLLENIDKGLAARWLVVQAVAFGRRSVQWLCSWSGKRSMNLESLLYIWSRGRALAAMVTKDPVAAEC
jgi:hypothetical protein